MSAIKSFFISALTTMGLLFYAGAVSAQPGTIRTFTTMAVLRAIPATAAITNTPAQLLGYYAVGDFGAPETFIWTAASSATDDGCTIIKPTGLAGNGRWVLSWRVSLSIRQCGAKLDGSTSDTTAVQAALTAVGAAGGGVVVVPSGTVAHPSTEAVWAVANNTTIQCASRENSLFKMTGVAALDAMFTVTDPRNVFFKSCGFYGNSNAATANTAGAIFWYGSSGAASAMSNFGCIDCYMGNFQQSFWSYVRNDSIYPMSGYVIDGLKVLTFSGNMINPSDIAVPSFITAERGQFLNLGGLISGVSIRNVQADGTWVKGFHVMWSGVTNVVGDSWILNSFGANASNEAGAYCSLKYDDDAGSTGADKPGDLYLNNMNFTACRTSGHYEAPNGSTGCTYITNFTASGQFDTSGGLPHAAISLNGTKCANIENYNLSENYHSIIAGGAVGSAIHIGQGKIVSTIADAVGITLQSSTISNATSITEVRGASVVLTGSSSNAMLIQSQSGSGYQPGLVKVIGGLFSGTIGDIKTNDLTTSQGVQTAGVQLTGGVVLTGAGQGFVAPSTDTPILLDGVIVDGSTICSACIGVNLNAATKITIASLDLRNRSGGSNQMLVVDGANGAMPVGALRFYNVTALRRLTSTDFCVTTPTWSADQGSVVARCTPVEAGSAMSKYIIISDTNTDGSTTWLNNRTLTGN